MDDHRADRIEEKLDAEIVEAATARGELRQFMASTDSFIKAVSAKSDKVLEKLEEHNKDANAHEEVRKGVVVRIVGWLTAIGGCSGLIVAGFSWLMSRGHKGP